MIYFIQAQTLRLIKIGYVERFDLEGARVRLKTFQIGSPDKLKLVAVVDGQKPYETQLHRRFKAHRVHGEWLSPADALLNLIASLRMAYAKKVMADLTVCRFSLRLDRQRLMVSPIGRFDQGWKGIVQFSLPELKELLAHEDSRRPEADARGEAVRGETAR